MTKTLIEKTTVYETYNYDLFTFLDSNRKTNKSNLKKLKESMKEEQLIIPIIVNELFQIIDGQHRYITSKELGLPIYYIINVGYGIEQVKRANTTGVKWTVDDFLTSYKEQGYENYEEFSNIKKEFMLGTHTLIKIFATFSNKIIQTAVSEFENGEFLTKENAAAVRHFCSQLEMFKPYKGYKSSSFTTAFLKLYLHEDYNPQQMEKQAKYISHFNPSSGTQEILLRDLCSQVYSFRISRKEDKILYSFEEKTFFKKGTGS